MPRQRTVLSSPETHGKAGALLVATAACLWGLWPLWIRGEAGGRTTSALALLAAGLFGLPWASRQTRARFPRPGRAWMILAGLGISNAANTWLYFRALDEGVVAPAVLSHYLAPVLVALGAPVFLGEPRSPRTPLALLLGSGGTAALLLGGSSLDGAVGHAVVLGGASALFYAGSVLLAKKLAPYFDSAELFVYSALLSAALLLPLATPLGKPDAWLRPALGGLVSGLIAGTVYYAGLRRLAAERAGVLTYLEVPAAAMVGWVAYGEAPGPAALIGGLLILAAGTLAVGAGRSTP